MKNKTLILALALLFAFAGTANAQDLIPEKVISLKGLQDIGYPWEFVYSNEKNLLAMRGDYDIHIINADTKEILLKVKPMEDFAFFNKGQNFIGMKDTRIKIYNTTTWDVYDSLTYNDLTVLDFVLSKDQKKICVLYRNGANIYPDMRLVIFDMTTKEIILEKTINCEFDFQITNKDEFSFINMDWNENLNYLSFEWSLYKDVNTPFRSGREFIKIYSINENKMKKEYSNNCSFIFDDNTNNAYFYESYYDSESRYCTNRKLVTIISLESDQKTKINFDFDQAFMDMTTNYLVFSKSPSADEIFIINKENLQTKTLKTSYYHFEFSFTEDKTKLIAQSKTSSKTIAIYDITNITGINEPNKVSILFPNPTNHTLNLELDNSLDYNIQIIDESGKVIESIPISNSYQLNYNTSQLPKGIYILQLNSKWSSVSYKFLKE